MNYVCAVLIFSLLSASCGIRINYLGSTGAPTENVDVYVDASAIKRPYTIVGKGYPSHLGYPGWLNSTDKLQQKVVSVARKKGADAVLFQDLLQGSTGMNAALRTDGVAEGQVTTGAHSSVTMVERLILFLRYD